jgi:hypothetical protein
MTFQLYGIIPIPAWLVVSGIFAYDSYSTIKGTVSGEHLSLFCRMILIYPVLEWHNGFCWAYWWPVGWCGLLYGPSLSHLLDVPAY